MLQTMVSLFLTGVLFGAGPCLLSCGPVMVSYFAATGTSIRSSVVDYLLFSAARVAMYVLLASLAFALGEFATQSMIAQYYRYLFILVGFFLALIGLHLMAGMRMEVKPFTLVYRYIVKGRAKNMLLLGAAYGLLPCAPFLALVSYLGMVSGTWSKNLFYAGVFGLGTVASPLFLLVFSAGSFGTFLKNKKPLYSRILNIVCGLVMVFLGIQLAAQALIF